jgi:CBS domain-containing protein
MTISMVEGLSCPSVTVISIRPGDTVVDAARKMSDHDIGSLLVLDDDSSVVGIITERDIMRKLVAKALNTAQTTVAQVMVKDVLSCSPETALSEAERIMAKNQIRHLPIIKNGFALGMISSRDIMAHKLTAAQAAVRRQSHILQDLEFQHPGITRLETDSAGRIIM